jgi:hypothetical protein
MNKYFVVGAVCLGALTAQAGTPPQVIQTSTARVGSPMRPDAWGPTSTRAAVNPDDAQGAQSPADDPVLEATLPKLLFDAGEPVDLSISLQSRTGGGIEGADIGVEDEYTRKSLDRRSHGRRQTATSQGHGQYHVTLDNSPGEHTLTIRGTATFRGHTVHRATSSSYTVASGAVTIVGMGKVRIKGPMVVVPLYVTCRQAGYVSISATIANKDSLVANVQVGAFLDAGASTVDLTFRQADLVEPGPYQLVKVMAMVSDDQGGTLAAALNMVGHPFNVAGGGHGHEPPPATDDRGQIVGGPYGEGEAVTANEPVPTEPAPSLPDPR